MQSAIDIAKYLVHLAAAEDEPDQLSPMRLQKLLYYVQGWAMGLSGKPMFGEKIRAWVHGPVVKEVYKAFEGYGANSIPAADIDYPNLPEDDRQFINEVWQAYKPYSAISLRQMTHRESPWLDARKGYGPTDRCDVEITVEALRNFFTPSEAD